METFVCRSRDDRDLALNGKALRTIPVDAPFITRHV
jgi:hypothetical protein